MDHSTIAAIATPNGRGGIGIIRISGPNAFHIGALVFRNSRPLSSKPAQPEKVNTHARTVPTPGLPTDPDCFDTHKLYHGFIIQPKTLQIADEVLCTFMRAPHTYTREDVVEIHSHGNPYVLHTILDTILQTGATLAEPGEFTRRAFLNGRIDLVQAEAVADLINAKSNAAVRIAASHLEGNFGESLSQIKQTLLNVLANLEAAIDFPEESDLSLLPAQSLVESFDRVLSSLDHLIHLYQTGRTLREGIKIVIVGAPNVGKSSLMNCLLQTNRSIVTEIPGTTRDIVADTFYIKGIPVTILDTAGIHETEDPVESIGVTRALECAGTADLLLFVFEAGRLLTDTEKSVLSRFENHNRCIIVNKADLFRDHPDKLIPSALLGTNPVIISALHNEGIQELIASIARICIDQNIETAAVAPNLRQKNALMECRSACDSAKTALLDHMPEEIVSIDVQAAIGYIRQLSGESIADDVLDTIFSSFCIGK